MTSVLCPECKRTIGSPTGLVAHMKSMHHDVHMRNVEAERARTGLTSVPPPSSNGHGIRWEDPPMGRGRHRQLADVFQPFVDELKRNPGKWGRVVEYKSATSASTQASKLRKLFADFEILGRRVDSGSAIFARYVEAE